MGPTQAIGLAGYRIGFLLFFPKRKKGAGTLYEIPAPFLKTDNKKAPICRYRTQRIGASFLL